MDGNYYIEGLSSQTTRVKIRPLMDGNFAISLKQCLFLGLKSDH